MKTMHLVTKIGITSFRIISVGEQPSTENSSFNLSREFPYKLSPLESLAIHRMFHGLDSIHSFVCSIQLKRVKHKQVNKS